MALTISASTDKVNIGNGAAIDNLSPCTQLVWGIPGASGARNLYQKGINAIDSTFNVFYIGGSGELSTNVQRATTSCFGQSSTSFATASVLGFFGRTFDLSTGVPKVYYGNRTTIAAEPGTYLTQTLGSGAHTSDASKNAIIGNKANDSQVFGGAMSWMGIWNRILTLEEIIAQQFFPHVTSGCVYFCHLGYAGTGTQPDWSGNGFAGTVTGCSVASHAPIFPAFGRDNVALYKILHGRIFALAGDGGGLAGRYRGLAG